MAKLKDKKLKEDIIKRLRNIKGHVNGIERMVEKEEQECVDLLVQISAVKSSLHKIGLALIKNNASECIIEAIEEDEQLEESIDEAVETILKFGK